MTKSDKHDQIHVDNFQKRHFSEIKKINAKNLTGLGWGWGDWGITHSPTHSKCSYPTPLLNPPTQGGYSRLPTDVF